MISLKKNPSLKIQAEILILQDFSYQTNQSNLLVPTFKKKKIKEKGHANCFMLKRKGKKKVILTFCFLKLLVFIFLQ